MFKLFNKPKRSFQDHGGTPWFMLDDMGDGLYHLKFTRAGLELLQVACDNNDGSPKVDEATCFRAICALLADHLNEFLVGPYNYDQPATGYMSSDSRFGTFDAFDDLPF